MWNRQVIRINKSYQGNQVLSNKRRDRMEEKHEEICVRGDLQQMHLRSYQIIGVRLRKSM